MFLESETPNLLRFDVFLFNAFVALVDFNDVRKLTTFPTVEVISAHFPTFVDYPYESIPRSKPIVLTEQKVG